MQCEFVDQLTEIFAARRFAECVVGGGHERLSDVLVVVSELASNALRHAGTGFSLTVDDGRQHVRIEVVDRGGGWPVVVDGSTLPSSGGMGLHLVDALADRWGASARPGGKAVWAELDRPCRPIG